MFYLVQIVRNEENEITDRVILGKSPKNEMNSKKEHTVIFDEVDHDIDRSMVSVDGNGDLFIEEDPDKIAAIDQEVEIALRVKRIQFGQRLIAIMSIRNDAKELTPSEIVELVATFQTVNTAWLNGSIATSRAIVEAITPDEVLITTADKTAILAEIDANLTALGY